jgi:hypothetical protein
VELLIGIQGRKFNRFRNDILDIINPPQIEGELNFEYYTTLLVLILVKNIQIFLDTTHNDTIHAKPPSPPTPMQIFLDTTDTYANFTNCSSYIDTRLHQPTFTDPPPLTPASILGTNYSYYIVHMYRGYHTQKDSNNNCDHRHD